jgi:hypothetical protein
MEFIRSINSAQLNSLIQSASERVILAIPGLFCENQKVIESKFLSGFKNIKVILNCNETIIRQGYGDIESIGKLREIGVPIYDQPQNLVSFVIVDKKGFFLFPQSRIFLADSHQFQNAIEMDPVTLEQIIGLFFPPNPSEKAQFQDKLANAVILSSQRVNKIDEILKDGVKIKVSILSDQNFNIVKKAIDSNKPIHPDLKRQLEYYTTNFLWIDLKFKGANISTKTISVPKHVIPINSEDLRKKLTSSLKLFENVEESTWYYKLKDINEDVNALRKKYLHPIKEKGGMNIISKVDFAGFLLEYKSSQQLIEKTTIEVTQKINDGIESTKSKFRDALREYYDKNPTDEMKLAPSYRRQILESFIQSKVKSIDFPEADELLSNFSLNYHSYELTTEDFRNLKLIEELKSKNILSEDDVKDLKNTGIGFQSKQTERTLFDPDNSIPD